jgi:hypothetical protein
VQERRGGDEATQLWGEEAVHDSAWCSGGGRGRWHMGGWRNSRLSWAEVGHRLVQSGPDDWAVHGRKQGKVSGRKIGVWPKGERRELGCEI